jgi:RNA polymerase sigma-70 factor (ECF subfamily)
MDKVFEPGLPRMALERRDVRMLPGAFLAGRPDAIRVVDGWIEGVLRAEFSGQRAQWDDLRQDIRMRVLVNFRNRRFRGESELRTYVHRIARYAAIDAWRRSRVWRARLEMTDGEARDPAPMGQERLATRDLLRKMLLGLSRDDRRLLDLVFVERLSYSEVAGRLRINEGAVKVRVFRCRERLLGLRRRLLGLET